MYAHRQDLTSAVSAAILATLGLGEHLMGLAVLVVAAGLLSGAEFRFDSGKIPDGWRFLSRRKGCAAALFISLNKDCKGRQGQTDRATPY